MLGRAVRLRCAWCGARRGIIRSWFRRDDSCQTCGLSVQRGQEGFELGSASINAIVTFAAIIIAATISIVVTYPEIAVVPLSIVLGAVAIVLPIVLYPFTHTIWFAVELLMEPPSAQELGDATRRMVATTAANPAATAAGTPAATAKTPKGPSGESSRGSSGRSPGDA